jgi:hypothetical protein
MSYIIPASARRRNRQKSTYYRVGGKEFMGEFHSVGLKVKRTGKHGYVLVIEAGGAVRGWAGWLPTQAAAEAKRQELLQAGTYQALSITYLKDIPACIPAL